MNEHIYKYYRFKAWVAMKLRRQLAQTIYLQRAEDERANHEHT